MHPVIQSSGQSQKWEKGCLIGREAPSQRSKPWQEREGNVAHRLCRWRLWAWGSLRSSETEDVQEKGRSKHKGKLSGIQSSREWGKKVWNCQAKEMHNLFYLCGPHSPHPSITDSSDRDSSCSRKFSNQLYVCTGTCTEHDLGLWILQKYLKKTNRKHQ